MMLAALCTAIRALAFGFRAEHGVAGACQERSHAYGRHAKQVLPAVMLLEDVEHLVLTH